MIQITQTILALVGQLAANLGIVHSLPGKIEVGAANI